MTASTLLASDGGAPDDPPTRSRPTHRSGLAGRGLKWGVASTDRGRGDGRAAGSTPEAARILLGLVPDVEPHTTPEPVATRTKTWDLGSITLADGVPAPLRGVIAWPEQLEAGVHPPLVMVLHGSHPIRRDDPSTCGSWPCPAGTEWVRPEQAEPRTATVEGSGPLSIDVQVGFGRQVTASRAPDPGMTGTQSTGRSARWRRSRPSDRPSGHSRAAIDPSRIRGRRRPHMSGMARQASPGRAIVWSPSLGSARTTSSTAAASEAHTRLHPACTGQA
jgi:hypothetical protein